MTNWVLKHKNGIIRAAFLIPILSVALISISHVVSWYDLSNPLSWAIYLSIAVEIAAMSALAAASIRIKGASVWFVFGIVTLIQFIGNIFFSYKEINVNDSAFKSWMELTGPIFESMGSDVTDIIAQKRWLALLEGGLLPLISLTSLHFFIRYGDMDKEIENEKPIAKPVNSKKSVPISEIPVPKKEDQVTVEYVRENSREAQAVDESKEEIVEENIEPTEEKKKEHPSYLKKKLDEKKQ